MEGPEGGLLPGMAPWYLNTPCLSPLPVPVLLREAAGEEGLLGCCGPSCHRLVVSSHTSHFTFLRLSCFICKAMIITASQKFVMRINKDNVCKLLSIIHGIGQMLTTISYHYGYYY